jgi:molecular chaperone GrpE
MLANLSKNILSKTQLLNITKSASVLLSTSTSEPEAEPKPIDPAEFKQLEEKLAKAEASVADFKDRYMRSLAETENVRVRMNKMVDDAKVFGIQGFCKDLLEVADILNLAVVNTDPAKQRNNNETIAELNEKLGAMYNGLVMTEKCLLKIFEKNNLTRINPAEGDKFDPNLHDAIFRVPIPDKVSGTINVTTKFGFKLRDRVIRAAQVGVVQ